MHFQEGEILFILYVLKKKFLGRTKIWAAQKNLGGIAPWLRACV